jgi:hypothetical protein
LYLAGFGRKILKQLSRIDSAYPCRQYQYEYADPAASDRQSAAAEPASILNIRTLAVISPPHIVPTLLTPLSLIKA